MKKQILLIAFVCLSFIANAQWQLTGNAGTNPAVNFIGTTDAVPLIFKIGGNPFGKLSNSSLAFGFNSGVNITTGISNNLYGSLSGQFLTSGSQNCFFGDFTGNANTTGGANNYFGHAAGSSNITGSANCFFGHSSGQANTASNNSFFGHVSGVFNTTGASNAFFGALSGNINTTGSFNTFFGSRAGQSNTTGANNTFIGYLADGTSSSLTNATAIGANSVVSASNSLVLGNAANVGIGISAPLEKLHVIGNVRMEDGNQAAGKVLTSDANGKATWQVIPPAIPTGTASGDLNGTYPNPSVDGLQGVAVSATAPTNGQVLQFNGTSWTPSSLPVASTDWAVNGNSGTNATTNFIGTTDNISLNFRVNNTRAGKIDNTSSNSTFMGLNSGPATISSVENTFYGAATGKLLTSGAANNFFGFAAGGVNTTGTQNSFFGHTSGALTTTGNQNSFIGNDAGFANTSGSNIVAVGYGAGSANDISSSCTFVGFDADQAVTTDFTNSTALGNTSRITASNQVRIGNATVTSIGGFANWTNVSDKRFKTDVKETVPGMEFINKLRPVTYHLDINAINKFVKLENADAASVKAKSAELQSGFIAQEVEEAAKKTGYDFSGVDKPKSEEDFYGLRYAEFVVPMVKGMQELDAENKKLKMENEELKKRLEKIERYLGFDKPQADNYFQKLVLRNEGKTALLDQNYPNPFNTKTTIRYFLPEKIKNAYLVITAANGIVLSKQTINGRGQGSIEIDAAGLATGNYIYSLYADDALIATKQFILIR